MKHKPESPSIQTYTPQPSTPIKHAGSDIWDESENGREQNRMGRGGKIGRRGREEWEGKEREGRKRKKRIGEDEKRRERKGR